MKEEIMGFEYYQGPEQLAAMGTVDGSYVEELFNSFWDFLLFIISNYNLEEGTSYQ